MEDFASTWLPTRALYFDAKLQADAYVASRNNYNNSFQWQDPVAKCFTSVIGIDTTLAAITHYVQHGHHSRRFWKGLLFVPVSCPWTQVAFTTRVIFIIRNESGMDDVPLLSMEGVKQCAWCFSSPPLAVVTMLRTAAPEHGVL
jgi:hypothetical protein